MGVNRVRKTCYACDRTAVTREHAPPSCFFPPSCRANSITVPSCKIHNHEYSKDVEYVRSILVCFSDLKPNSQPVFDKMMRSLDYRPALVDTIFQELRPLWRNGEETAAFTVDLRRLERVIFAIAQAIHYRDFSEKIRYWDMF